LPKGEWEKLLQLKRLFFWFEVKARKSFDIPHSASDYFPIFVAHPAFRCNLSQKLQFFGKR
jgi:hypothetical protein